MIEVDRLTKRYGSVVALEGISFEIARGEIVGFLGPNGAGKSTTLRIIAGFIGATSGRVRVAGYDVREEPIQSRRNIGYMPEAAPLYPEMRVREYLSFRAALKGVARRRRALAVSEAMERAGVSEVSEMLILHLSKGYRQRTALADALVADPPLLILDEPTSGLDPNQILEVRALIGDLANDRTVFLSTHMLTEVEATCERAIVIHQGRLMAQGTVTELRDRETSRRARLELNDPKGALDSILAGHPHVVSARASSEVAGSNVRVWRVDFDVAASLALEELLPVLLAHDIGVREARVERAKLEDVFRSLTQDGDGGVSMKGNP